MPDFDEPGAAGAPPARDPSSKTEHLDACLTPAVEYSKRAGFESFDFVNQALPELALEDIDLSTSMCGKELAAPLMIAPMTGGVERAHQLNLRLARAAQRFGLAMGVGSQRVALEDGARARFFEVRSAAPDILLFANFGAAQLAHGWGVDHARRAVDMIEADALFLHFNPVQEAAQGGDVDFRGLAGRVRDLCAAMRDRGVPVFAREVGFGISTEAARALIDAGVSGIDCAGAGGTSWAKVEAVCAKSERRRRMGAAFGEWGIPTADSIRAVRAASKRVPLIATGGLRSGLDVAKAIALGADVGAMARPFLVAAHQGDDALAAFVTDTLDELTVAMFGVGAPDLDALRSTPNLRDVSHSDVPPAR
ncbi:MAG: type 2 isopentenyl-diphosphate Delta-isomerase [Deltaproteobacteria bacterium RBG_16_71_12]|nr:MAG: type 2 isopentenyl-diphosphate Delta-isomerase [Deltaproteobacteria bacterium RBG_16_71_12]